MSRSENFILGNDDTTARVRAGIPQRTLVREIGNVRRTAADDMVRRVA